MIRPSRFFACRALALLALLFALPAQAAFTDNGDGTVTDTVTGLMWDKCSWGQSNNTTCADTAATTHTWTQALGVAVTANAMNGGVGYKSHNDWRPPNKNELESLVKIDVSSPAIDIAAFPNTQSSYYWTSTSYAPDPAVAWLVNFNNGSPSPTVRPITTMFGLCVADSYLTLLIPNKWPSPIPPPPSPKRRRTTAAPAPASP